MTLAQILTLYPDSEAGDWRQHDNGGGWVQSSATVGPEVFVGAHARVTGEAQVLDKVKLLGTAQVSGRAVVSGEAVVSGSAHLTGTARIAGKARIAGDEWDKAPLYIEGSVYPVTASSKNSVSIGCHTHTLEWWFRYGLGMAKSEIFDEAQTLEYRSYLELIRSLSLRSQPHVLSFTAATAARLGPEEELHELPL